jgi:RHS repeat-associated protein
MIGMDFCSERAQVVAMKCGLNASRTIGKWSSNKVNECQFSRTDPFIARLNEQLAYGFDPAGNLNYRTNNGLIQDFVVNSNNELTSATTSGTLTVMGTTTSAATNVTVNGNLASFYGDATFAAAGLSLTSSYTAVASDTNGRWATNTVNVDLATSVPFQYDLNGNLTNDGLRSFAYDDENQLIQVWVPGQWSSVFTYDGKMRRRIRQEFTWNTNSDQWVQTNAVYYVYDGNLVIQERDLNNLPTTTYARGKDLSGSIEAGLPRQSEATAGGIGGLLARTSQQYADGPLAGNAFYHADANGNVTMLVNSSQAVVAKYLYDAFGNVLSASGLLVDANRYQFSSKEKDSNSGLIYYLYRYYDPNLQRWPNRDPLGEKGFEANRSLVPVQLMGLLPPPELLRGPDLYTYVGNDPEDKHDSFGLAFGGVWHPNQCPLRPSPCSKSGCMKSCTVITATCYILCLIQPESCVACRTFGAACVLACQRCSAP